MSETNYDDNVGQTTIIIPNHPDRKGVGPLAGNSEPTEECDKGCYQLLRRPRGSSSV